MRNSKRKRKIFIILIFSAFLVFNFSLPDIGLSLRPRPIAERFEEKDGDQIFRDWGDFSESDKGKLIEELNQATPLEELKKYQEAVAPQRKYKPPDTEYLWETKVDKGKEAESVEDLYIILTAGGGGTRFENSLPANLRERLQADGLLAKPTYPAIPGGEVSPLLSILESISDIKSQTNVEIPVIIVVASDTEKQVIEDIKKYEELHGGLNLSNLFIVRQEEVPTLDTDGKVITTYINGKPHIVKNAKGSLGTLMVLKKNYSDIKVEGKDLEGHNTLAGFLKEQGKKRCLILFGDEPGLPTQEFIYKVAQVSNGVDLLVIGVEKIGLTIPPGGTICKINGVLNIVELKERTAELDEAEEKHFNETGKYYLLNTGPMCLSQKAVDLVLGHKFPLRVAHRYVRVTDKSGNEKFIDARKIEEYLPDIVKFLSENNNTTKVFEVEQDAYFSIKDFSRILAFRRLIIEQGIGFFEAQGVEIDKKHSWVIKGRLFSGELPNSQKLDLASNLIIRGNVCVYFDKDKVIIRLVEKKRGVIEFEDEDKAREQYDAIVRINSLPYFRSIVKKIRLRLKEKKIIMTYRDTSKDYVVLSLDDLMIKIQEGRFVINEEFVRRKLNERRKSNTINDEFELINYTLQSVLKAISFVDSLRGNNLIFEGTRYNKFNDYLQGAR